jgi:O-antigen ligase
VIKKLWPVWFSLYMTVLGGNWMVVNNVLAVRVIQHVLLTAILVYWFWHHGLPSSPMLLPAGIVAAAVGLSIPNAVDPRMALENAWGWITNIGLFLVVIHWLQKGYGDALFGGQFVSGGVLAGSSVLQYLALPTMRTSGIFLGIPTLTGAYSSALTVPAISWAFGGATKKRRWLLLTLAASLVLTITMSQSRGAFGSLGVAALIYFGPKVIRSWHLNLLFAPAIALIGAIIFILASQSGHINGDVLRMDLWRAALQMTAQNPTGVGVGDFDQVYRQIGLHKSPEHLDTDGLTGAHNLYLNLGAELGLPGIAAGAAFLASFAYLLTKTTWNPQKLAVLAALAGILVQMLGDNFPTQNWTFLVSLYGAFLIHDIRLNFSAKRFGRTIGFGLLGFALVMLAFDRAQFFYERSLTGDLAAALQAAQLDPGLKLYQMNIARMLGNPTSGIDPTVDSQTNLRLYALVNYARPW